MSAFHERLGHCYELAGQLVLNDHGLHDLTLVHGSIQGAGYQRISHAWVVLETGEIWEPITNQTWPTQVFERFFSAQPEHMYTYTQVLKKILRSKHWGPWDGHMYPNPNGRGKTGPAPRERESLRKRYRYYAGLYYPGEAFAEKQAEFSNWCDMHAWVQKQGLDPRAGVLYVSDSHREDLDLVLEQWWRWTLPA